MKKHILIASVFMIVFANNFVYGQYTGDLPPMATPMEDNYTHDQTLKGHYFLMNYKGQTSENKATYSFLFAGNNEVVRVCQNGTLALMGSLVGAGKYPSFNLNTPEGRYLASITAQNDNLNLIAKNQMKFRVNTSHEIVSLSNNKVSIYENLEMTKNDVILRFGLDNANAYGWIGTTSANGCYLGASGHAAMFMDVDRNVYVGGIISTDVAKYKTELKNKYSLFVKEGVLSEDFAIAPIASWSDFVFEKDYNLRPLPEVEKFIKTNKHLPDVPSAKQVAEEGYSQHDVNKALLQKVEELTLYVIELQKQIEILKVE